MGVKNDRKRVEKLDLFFLVLNVLTVKNKSGKNKTNLYNKNKKPKPKLKGERKKCLSKMTSLLTNSS